MKLLTVLVLPLLRVRSSVCILYLFVCQMVFQQFEDLLQQFSGNKAFCQCVCVHVGCVCMLGVIDVR